LLRLPIQSDLPAKSDAEIKKHQKMYDVMVSQARKKGGMCVCACVCCGSTLSACPSICVHSYPLCLFVELKVAKQKMKEEQSRRKKDEITSAQLHRWSTEILPHWETM